VPVNLVQTILGTTLALAVVSDLHAEWDQWRGPGRDGVLLQGAPWPEKLADGSMVQRWRVPMGPSYSGPLIVGDRVFVTEAKEKRFEAVVALDRATGAQVWRHEWEGYQKVPFFAKSNGDWIRSTPAWSEGRLYVGGMQDVLVCLEAATGKELWRFDFPKQLGKAPPDFGFVSSPLVAGDAVYVQAGAGFATLDKVTGSLVWRSLDDGGGMWGSAFSSPVLARIGGEEQLVVQTRDKLAGVRVADGKVLWTQTIKAFRGMNILTPVVAGDRVLTSSYGGETQGWSVTRKGEEWEVKPEWSLKVEGYMSTPVVVAGQAYLHSRAQKLVCFDVATGVKRWETEQKFGKYMSLVAQGDRILALDERGILFLFRADASGFKLEGQRKMADAEAWAHLALSGGDVVVREQTGVSAWAWSAVPAKPPGS
jgi:outer membrane protein assembly factor BamB